MLADCKKMFENDALSDFQLIMNDEKVLKAHTAFLTARSPVFFTMLTTNTEEKQQGSVHVPDVDSVVMKEVLRFIYCSEVERLEEIAPKLIFAAEKYQLKELKALCLQELTASLKLGNAVQFLKISFQLSDADNLFQNCLHMILK